MNARRNRGWLTALAWLAGSLLAGGFWWTVVALVLRLGR